MHKDCASLSCVEVLPLLQTVALRGAKGKFLCLYLSFLPPRPPQDFPLKADPSVPPTDFETDLIRYLEGGSDESQGWRGTTLRSTGEHVSPAVLRRYDFSSAGAELVPSVRSRSLLPKGKLTVQSTALRARAEISRPWRKLRLRAVQLRSPPSVLGH